jgi:DNA-binding SARP family transcriptional activator
MVAGTGQPAYGLRIELLGRVQAWSGERALAVGPPRQQALLAMLALRANRFVSRDELVDGIWGADPPASAVNGVHVYVSALRRALEPDRSTRAAGQVLTSAGSGYRLVLAADRVDVHAFATHLDRARQLAAGAGAVDAFDAALAVWTGTPLVGVPGPFADAERTRLAELQLTAIEERAEAMLGLGRHGELVADLSVLVVERPLREQLRALLMTALYRSGRQAEALAVYADTRRLLAEELGVEPGPHLQRVHHQILANDDSVGARRTERRADAVVPRQLPPSLSHFAGRAAELAALTRHLTPDPGAVGAVLVAAVHGTAGVGKTALAVYWAHQVAHRFPDGQLYVNLRGFDPSRAPMSAQEAVRGFLDAFAVPPERIPASLDAQTALYRSLLAGKSALVLLDNARDADQVRPLLPGTPGCVAVLTSRNQLTPLVAEGAQPVPLDLPSHEEARDLFIRRLGRERVGAESGAVDAVVTHCARLPLALAIVAARAASNHHLRLAAFAAELDDAGTRLDTLSAGDATTTVHTVFSWSYRALAPRTARVFRLLGQMPGPDVSAAAAASLAGLPLAEARSLLAELTRAHLTVEPAPDRYTLHDLLRAYANQLVHTVDPEDERDAATRRILDHYLHTARVAALLLNPHRDPLAPTAPEPGTVPEHLTGDRQALAWLAAERHNLLAATEHAARTGQRARTWQLAWALQEYLDRRGHWHDWVATQQAALAAGIQQPDRPTQARAHRSLGMAHDQLGQRAQARQHLKAALDLYHRLDDRAGQAYTHLLIARTAERDADIQRALRHSEDALSLYQAADHRAGRARALATIAWYHTCLGRHRQAVTACRQALSLLRELGDRTGEAAAWDSLGHAHHHLDEYAVAADAYHRALDLFRHLGDRYNEAMTLSRLADTHHATGAADTARATCRQALAILGDLDHPDAVAVRAQLHRLCPGGS